MINIREDFSGFLKNALKYDFESQMVKVGLATKQKISERADKGVDVDNKPFKEYSKGYQDFKKQKKRSIKPNLQFTGEMLNAIKSEVSRSGDGFDVNVGFDNRRHTETGEKIEDIAEKNDQTRPFFSLNKKEYDEIVDKLIFDPYERFIGG